MRSLNNTLIILSIVTITLLTGCATEPSKSVGKHFLSLNFEKGKTLSYQFTSLRDITMDWGPLKPNDPDSAHKIDRSTESVKMTVDYTTIDVDTFGYATIEGKIRNVTLSHKGRAGAKSAKTNAVKNFNDKSFKFTIDAAGHFGDRSELDNLIKEVGKTAFRKDRRVKNPDNIDDFIATQWFLWDVISSIPNAAQGLNIDDTWNSQLSIPTPMVMRKARDVEYKLTKIENQNGKQVADIAGTYSIAKKYPTGWPIPYAGSFQMSGTYGFLRAYKMLVLEGNSQSLFDIDAGVLFKQNQYYDLKVEASFPFAIGQKPIIGIKQRIYTNLVDAPEKKSK
jgi:hypothetical protein